MTDIQLADVCTRIAEMMISGGAEIYRVEDTVTRICRAYGRDSAQIYATPANFMITLKTDGKPPVTDCVTISKRSANLDRVGKLNGLSRRICAGKPSANRIVKSLDEIKKEKTYSDGLRFISYFVAGAAFTVVYGGGIAEALIGGLLGMGARLTERQLDKVNASTFLKSLVCSMIISFIAVGLSGWGVIPRFDRIIIGTSMTLVPGIAMTNCMRDFISGDFMSGLYTLTEALLTAAGLAVGAGSAVAAVITL